MTDTNETDATAVDPFLVPYLKSKLKIPTLTQLLDCNFRNRQHLLFPWLREQESCMVYSGTGVGKSMFALSAALAIAGGGEFLGWTVDERAAGGGWKVLYIDGEMHIEDIQERARMLRDAVPGLDQAKAGANLKLLARQHQHSAAQFPLITEKDGMAFILEQVANGPLDLIILDNFSTLGEVEDENAASSFNKIQEFLLNLKQANVATILVHHAGKSGDFRGSSKLAATFETIIQLERLKEETEQSEAQFRVRWNKVRAGGPKRKVREVIAKLSSSEQTNGASKTTWNFEAQDLVLLDDIKEQFEAGAFINQKEIADYCGKSPPTARAYIDRGIALGMWTEDRVSKWFGTGKFLRDGGKTKAPVRPSLDWKTEVLIEKPEGEAPPARPFDF